DTIIDIEGIESASGKTLDYLIYKFINASEPLNARQRVLIVRTLVAGLSSTFNIDLSKVDTRADGLSAELRKERLVPDSEDTFNHFVSAGRQSMEPALDYSRKAPTFLTPPLIDGYESQ